MRELFKTIVKSFLDLSKKTKLMLGGVILFIILFSISGGIGSNNELENINNGIQGNGNSQNNGNSVINGSDNIQGNGNSIQKIYNMPNTQKEKPFKEDFTLKKGGFFVVSDNWEEKWEPYLTIYENFVDIHTPKGYLLLNSPNQKNIKKASSEKTIEVSGYIRTTNGIFYMTKYSYVNRKKDGFPKFIYPIK